VSCHQIVNQFHLFLFLYLAPQTKLKKMFLLKNSSMNLFKSFERRRSEKRARYGGVGKGIGTGSSVTDFVLYILA